MRTLFVCTGNTCRSPLAERLARQRYPEHHWESAGVMPTGWMHPQTAAVLKARGADSAGFSGRDVADLDLGDYDHIVLIGQTAASLAPDPPPTVSVHRWDVEDPFNVIGTPGRVNAVYEACADELTGLIDALVASF